MGGGGLLILCLCITCVPSAGSVQKREWRSSRPRVTEGCESLYEFWELNLSPLEDQLVLLTAASSLQPQ